MKKNFERVKLIQLILYILIMIAALVIVCTDAPLYQAVGKDPSVRLLCVLLWITLGLSFAGLFWDHSTHSAFKTDYRALDQAVHSDPVAGIANRYSCDAIIAKYVDQPLPDNIGCVMLDISNIRSINEKYGHIRGNEVLRDFSYMLSTASPGLCFVGRNGGNKFLALFENCSEDKFGRFLSNVDRLIAARNADTALPSIEYRVGRAFSRDDRVSDITRLIALADRRLAGNTDELTGFANRAGCDAIIAKYTDMPLPADIACVMLDITNIRDINECFGRAKGNAAIRLFGDCVREASHDFGVAGRNGGSKFLIVAENCTDEKLHRFQTILRDLVNSGCAEPGMKVEYSVGIAFHEGNVAREIHDLVVLADRRTRDKEAEHAGN